MEWGGGRERIGQVRACPEQTFESIIYNIYIYSIIESYVNFKGNIDKVKVIPNHSFFLNSPGFIASQSRKTSAPCLRRQSSLYIRGPLGEFTVLGSRDPPTFYPRHHLFVNSTQHHSRARTAMTTASSTGVIKRNLIILIKNSTAKSVTGLGS